VEVDAAIFRAGFGSAMMRSMASEVTVLREADYREMPWKNGGGVTTEIAVHPAASDVGGAFLWRLSVARIDRSGPFSVFPGYDRTMLLLDGAGLDLDFGPRGRARLDRCFVPFAFRGEWEASCALLDGPVRDFNVMLDRARVVGQPRVLSLGSGSFRCPLSGTTVLLYVLRGRVRARFSGVMEAVELSANETLRLDDRGSERVLQLAGKSPDAMACLIDLTSRAKVAAPAVG
jgi:environmental stress-induced protein Ves